MLAFLLYFLAIGAGYILIEVALIQKFVLFLGHPTYALTVVIFSLLVSSGMGSYCSRQVIGSSAARWRAVLGGDRAPGRASGRRCHGAAPKPVYFAHRLESRDNRGADLAGRISHGYALPHGLGAPGRVAQPSVRWAWSLNAASSVLGSVGALVLAIYWGWSRRC